MTTNEILVAILQMSLTEAKETASNLDIYPQCGELLVKINHNITKALINLEDYEKRQKDKA